MWFIINGLQKEIAVCSIYFPPDGSNCNYDRDDYFDVLQNDILLIHYQPNFDVIILGNANERPGELQDFNMYIDEDDDVFIDPSVRIPIILFQIL